MSTEVTLVWIGGGTPPPWPAGTTVLAEPTPASVANRVAKKLPQSTADAWLFWCGDLGPPDPGRIAKALASPGDLWHAGLRLGTAGLPRAIDHVAPTWMLNRDPDPSVDATSWRVSLDACLVRTEVLRRIGTVHPEFRTLAGAALDYGHRCVRSGVLTRHAGWLAGDNTRREAPAIPIEDELRFLYYRFGRRWLRWAVFRMLLLGEAPRATTLGALRNVTRRPAPPAPRPFRESSEVSGSKRAEGSVTVLIPTVDRYPYLETLLGQLRRQTVRPLEIVIVDQTPAERRRQDLWQKFADLPLNVLQLDRAGQCSSRNAGIAVSRGDFLIFLDDDDEVPPDLIEKHLAALEHFRNDVSCGVAEEDGAGPIPAAFRLTRASDVFPTNNSMIRKSALAGSGLFDLAYDRGARADADLGMRSVSRWKPHGPQLRNPRSPPACSERRAPDPWRACHHLCEQPEPSFPAPSADGDGDLQGAPLLLAAPSRRESLALCPRNVQRPWRTPAAARQGGAGPPLAAAHSLDDAASGEDRRRDASRVPPDPSIRGRPPRRDGELNA